MKFIVEEISDYYRFISLEKEWNDLLSQAEANAPFLRHEWFRIWWNAFGKGKKMALLAVRCETGRLVAIAPLMEERARRAGIPCRILKSMSNDHSCRFDFIYLKEPRGSGGAAVEAIGHYIAARSPRVDLLELQDILEESETLRRLSEAARAGSLRVGRRPTLQTPYIPIEGDGVSYFNSISGHLKRNLRRRRRQIEEQGAVSISQFRGDEISGGTAGLMDRLQEGFRIEAMAWKGDAGTAIREDETWMEFYRRLAESAAERGWLRLYFLNLNEKPIAFYYTLFYDRKLYYLKLGYDPAYARYSPGILLHQEILSSLFDQKTAELDFLGPSMEWKEDWAKGARPHVWFYLFQKGFVARAIYLSKFKIAPHLRRFHRIRRLQQKFFPSVSSALKRDDTE